MSDPVVLVGTAKSDGRLTAVGLYADIDEAREAVSRGGLPDDCYYAVMTPQLGQTLRAREPEYDGKQSTVYAFGNWIPDAASQR